MCGRYRRGGVVTGQKTAPTDAMECAWPYLASGQPDQFYRCQIAYSDTPAAMPGCEADMADRPGMLTVAWTFSAR